MIKSSTLLKTKNGLKKICELTNTDLVLSYDIRTGKTCYKRPLYLSKFYYSGQIVKLDALHIAKIAGLIDYDLNYSEIIDSQLFIIPPKLNNFRLVDENLVPHKVNIEFDFDSDYYYNLVLYDTDCFFADGYLISNNITNIQEKRRDKFYTVNESLLNTNTEMLDKNVLNIFKKYNVPQDVIENTDLKYVSSSFAFSRHYFSESTYLSNLKYLDLMVSSVIIGERLI